MNNRSLKSPRQKRNHLLQPRGTTTRTLQNVVEPCNGVLLRPHRLNRPRAKPGKVKEQKKAKALAREVEVAQNHRVHHRTPRSNSLKRERNARAQLQQSKPLLPRIRPEEVAYRLILVLNL